MYDPRLWTFVADMNYSGSVTISDVWLWIKWFYFYPGDGFVYALINDKELHKFSNFFEISYNNYGGFLSGTVSLFFWFVLLPLLLYKVRQVLVESGASWSD